MHQWVYNNSIDIFKDNFTYRNTICTYPTRASNDLSVPFYRLTSSQQNIRYTGPKLWNSIPSNIKNIKYIATFKKHLKQYLLAKYF